MEGYKFMFDKNLLTLWSAPNYCYRCGNEAAILELNDCMAETFKKFKAVSDVNKIKNYKNVVPYFL